MRLKFCKILLIIFEFIIFVDFWIILAVFIYGGISYKLVSIGGLYFEAHKLWLPLIVFILSCGFWRLLKFYYPDIEFGNIYLNAWYYFIAILIIYYAIVIPRILYQYYSFDFGEAHDFALLHNAVFNTSNGDLLKTNIFSKYSPFANWNLLKDHYFLFLLIIAPFYKIFREGSFLVFLQTFVLSIGSVPIFLISLKKLCSQWSALLISVCYLFYPLLLELPFHGLRLEYYALVARVCYA